MLAAAIAGALLGDGLAYWIGHRSQREILGAWPLANYPKLVEESEAFFNKWGMLAVFFARFVPPIRAFVPITAGSLGMPPWKFYSVNVCADPALGGGACRCRAWSRSPCCINMPACRTTNMPASICGCSRRPLAPSSWVR